MGLLNGNGNGNGSRLNGHRNGNVGIDILVSDDTLSASSMGRLKRLFPESERFSPQEMYLAFVDSGIIARDFVLPSNERKLFLLPLALIHQQYGEDVLSLVEEQGKFIEQHFGVRNGNGQYHSNGNGHNGNGHHELSRERVPLTRSEVHAHFRPHMAQTYLEETTY